MRSLRDIIRTVLEQQAWVREWFCDGKVVCHTERCAFTAKELDAPFRARLVSLGCAGFDRNKNVRWVAMDFDVGHGLKSLASTDLAIAEALRVRSFVGGAADVRHSKSGRGIHVRVRLGDGVVDGRAVAANIARFLTRRLRLRTDWAALGHQSLDFWCRQPGPTSFLSIAECTGVWVPPLGALRPPEPAPRTPPNAVTLVECRTLSRKTLDFLEHGAVEGERAMRLFAAACDLAGNGVREGEAAPALLLSGESSGLRATEIEGIIRSAYSKPRRPARPMRPPHQ